MNDNKHTLLVCTVGGSPEPIVAALKHWQPLSVRFLPTPQTLEQIDKNILPLAADQGVSLDAGRYEIVELPDGQDFASCVDQLRQLTPVVEK